MASSGIPPQNLTKIVDPGFTNRGGGVGTGLGLAIRYRIIQQHQGRIEVQSAGEKGTMFPIILPTGSSATRSGEEGR